MNQCLNVKMNMINVKYFWQIPVLLETFTAFDVTLMAHLLLLNDTCVNDTSIFNPAVWPWHQQLILLSFYSIPGTIIPFSSSAPTVVTDLLYKDTRDLSTLQYTVTTNYNERYLVYAALLYLSAPNGWLKLSFYVSSYHNEPLRPVHCLYRVYLLPGPSESFNLCSLIKCGCRYRLCAK